MAENAVKWRKVKGEQIPKWLEVFDKGSSFNTIQAPLNLQTHLKSSLNRNDQSSLFLHIF